MLFRSVLLRVHDALLKRGVELAERDGHGRGAQRGEGVEAHLLRRHPDLDSREVLRLFDRQPAVGDVAKSVLPPGQADDALGLEDTEQGLPEPAVKGLVCLLVRGEGIGQLLDAELRVQGLERGASDQGAVDR